MFSIDGRIFPMSSRDAAADRAVLAFGAREWDRGQLDAMAGGLASALRARGSRRRSGSR